MAPTSCDCSLEGEPSSTGPGGETWRGDVPLRTPYQHALLRNRTEEAQLLADLGASTDVAEEDLAVAAVARGERRSARYPPSSTPIPRRC